MNVLEAREAFSHYTTSSSLSSLDSTEFLTHISFSIDPPYPVYGGLFSKEAVMLLRRFYIQENEKGK